VKKLDLLTFETHYIPEPNSGCWLWLGPYTNPAKAYGGWGRHEKAHRVSWQLTNGLIPAKLFVLHKCDISICVNPSHLFLGTQTDNLNDMTNKGRRYRKCFHQPGGTSKQYCPTCYKERKG
jgi:hypothetical protein